MKKNRKPKIAIIGVKGLPASGGAARAWENLISVLKDDFEFTVYAISSHTSNTYKNDGFNQIVFNSVSNNALNSLQYLLKSMCHCLFLRNFDLVVTNHVSSSFIIPFLRLKYKVLARAGGLSHLDTKWSKFSRLIFKNMMGVFVKFSSEVVCVSKEQADYLQRSYSKKIFSIPNGVVINEIMLSKKDNKNYILFSAARIVEIKGLHILLKAIKKIKYSGRLVIVGNLDHCSKYKETIRRLSIGINVEFTGIIKEKKKLYEIISNSSLFIFPSQTEAMSNMLLEVASLKTPIIASDINDNKTIFTENEVLFFRVDDVNSLSGKIDYALSNKKEMLVKAENAFNKIKSEYDINSTSMIYKKLIGSLLSF
ncbi:MAG: glycosyltransferase family 4 protein [Candidatus Cloacimonetes bacterium]|nr:glycosyltransferase family 4 protein [Candidatus Cloacimonadota bacterium]